jgi:hypothetical protein
MVILHDDYDSNNSFWKDMAKIYSVVKSCILVLLYTAYCSSQVLPPQDWFTDELFKQFATNESVSLRGTSRESFWKRTLQINHLTTNIKESKD